MRVVECRFTSTWLYNSTPLVVLLNFILFNLLFKYKKYDKALDVLTVMVFFALTAENTHNRGSLVNPG